MQNQELSTQPALYYFGTYLAARMANMPHLMALQLAQYCQTMDECAHDEQHHRLWYFKQYRFTPCHTTGSHGAELCFQQLPGLTTYSSDKNRIKLRLEVEALSQKVISSPTSLLSCEANSPMAMSMLNDSLYKSCYLPDMVPLKLALLGCRLYTYQNTWLCQPDTQWVPSREEYLVRIILWSAHVIRCYSQSVPVQAIDIQPLGEQHQALSSVLLRVFQQQDPVIHRQLWLNALPQMLELCQQSLPTEELWKDGINYRSQRLLTQAMISSGAGVSRQIRSLAGFKTSHWFKLHKAMEYHSKWLEHKIKQQNLSIDVAHSTGNIDMWRII